MAGKKNAYPFVFRSAGQKADFEKICQISNVSIRFLLQNLIDECIKKKRRVGLMP